MSDNRTLYNNSKRAYEYAIEEAYSELRRAQIDDDQIAEVQAVHKINDLDVRRKNLDSLYASAERQQPAGPPQRAVRFKDEYGTEHAAHMSDDERAIAHGIGGGRLSKEEAERVYMEQKAKFARMRADGSYRDDQGRVTR